MRRRRDPLADVAAWPNERDVAEMVGVHPSSITRMGVPGVAIRYGLREKRVRPTDALLIAHHFKRVSVYEVGASLYELARERTDRVTAKRVAKEVEVWLKKYGPRAVPPLWGGLSDAREGEHK